MTKKENRSDQAADLRKRAEEMTLEQAARSPENIEDLSPEETRQTLHELRVHQIELEIQNEELRRRQAELDAARARYFDLYDLAPVGYCTISEKGLILEANLTAATMLGVFRGTLVKQLFTRFIFKEDQGIYYRHRKQLFETGMPQVCEMRLVKKDGVPFRARFEATVAQDGENGNTVCRAVLSDITEQKRAEEALQKAHDELEHRVAERTKELVRANDALRESEQKYRSIFENATEGIFQTSPKGQFLNINPSYARMAGYASPEEMMESITDIDHQLYINPEDRAQFKRLVEERGIIEGYEVQHYCKDGSTIWVSINARCVYGEHGVLMHYEGFIENITGRRQAQEALRESEEHFRSLVSNIPGIVYRCVNDSNWTMFYISQEIDPVSDYPATDFINNAVRSYASIIHPDDRDLVDRAVQKGVNEKTAYSMEYRICRADGSIRWVHERGQGVFAPNGNLLWLDGVILDQTDRKQAEDMLWESEKRYKSLIENANEGIFIAQDSMLRFVNPAFVKILGYSEHELTTKPFIDFIHPEDRDMVLENHIRRMKGERFQSRYEFKMVTHNGITRDVELDSVMIQWNDKPAALGFINDITVRNQTEAALRESEEKFRVMVETFPLAIHLTTGIEQISEYVNPMFIKLFGYILDDIPTIEQWWLLACPDEQYRRQISKEWTTRVKRAIETQTPIEPMEVEVTCMDGSKKKISWGYVTMGEKNYSCGLDLTERKQAEAKLQASEEKYRTLFYGINDAVFVHDLDEEGLPVRFIQVNDVACRRLGYTREELLSLTPRDITLPEEYERIASKRNSLASQRDILMETIHVTKDGRKIPVESNIRKFKYLGRQTALSISRDITERKLAEDQIKALLAEKELLLKEVHHRIKNNMTVITSLLSLQAGMLKDPSAIAALEDAGSRILSMMVLYDKLYRSTDFREISAKEYLTSLVDEIVANFPNRGQVTIEKQIDDFILDAKTLFPIGIILNELLTNAMKHAFIGKENGAIGVSLSFKDNHAALTIQDNGIGIPESIDITISTGFGMQLVGILTEQLEGTIRIEREKGTRFILELDV